jgi:ParB-like chromosome segregation protein Spo0J
MTTSKTTTSRKTRTTEPAPDRVAKSQAEASSVSLPPTALVPPVLVCPDQPVSRVVWIPRDRLTANSWNPNRQAPPEHRLLKTSILENGWTQPLVVHQEGQDDQGLLYEIVDGYHRWLVSADKQVAALTDGLVPVVELVNPDPALARMATIRHNRARGVHGVLPMADLVAQLAELGIGDDEIGRRLEMDPEEVSRLKDRGVMVRRGASEGFGEGWTV